MIEPKVQVNAKTFQQPLLALNETMVKVLTSRGQDYFPDPEYAAADIALLLRYSSTIFRLLCFLNADIRRQTDTDWHIEYGVTAMALVRGMIDSLYNVTMILQDPSVYARRYHKSGIQRALKDLDEDRIRYSGQSEWDEYVRIRQKHLDEAIRKSKLTPAEMGGRRKMVDDGSISLPTSSWWLIGRPSAVSENLHIHGLAAVFGTVPWRL